VMLAVVLFAGVLTAIYSTWTSILRSSQVAQTAAAEVQRSRIAVRALEEALLGAQVPHPQTARASRQNERHYAFLAGRDGDAAYLSFVARLPESYPRGGRFGDRLIRRVTFNLERDGGGGNQLVLRQTPLLFEPDRDEEENPLVLAMDVQEFTLEFWDLQSREWQEDWAATNRVPALVRFSLATGRPQRGGVGPSGLTTRIIPMVGSGSLTGVRSALQAPVVEPVNPPVEPPPQPPLQP
jgi:type II secretion system protein J